MQVMLCWGYGLGKQLASYFEVLEEYRMLLRLYLLYLLHPVNLRVLTGLAYKIWKIKIELTVISVQSCILYFNLSLLLPSLVPEWIYSQMIY
jgi:hypothetical protein